MTTFHGSKPTLGFHIEVDIPSALDPGDTERIRDEMGLIVEGIERFLTYAGYAGRGGRTQISKRLLTPAEAEALNKG